MKKRRSRRRFVWRILREALNGYWRNDGDAFAGYIAFTGLLSIFPFLIFVTMLIGTFIGERQSDELTHALFEIVPSHIALTLEPVVDEVVRGASDRILTLSAIFAIYVASNAVESFRVAFDRAYRVIDPRGIIHARLIAIAYVFVGAIVSALLGASILLTPLIIQLLRGYGVPVPGFASYIANGFGAAVFVGFVYFLHRTLPGKGMKGMTLWPGVVVSTLVWHVAAIGFSIYLSYTPTYSLTYGALAGVIITLMFFYISGAVIIFGAEINAALNRELGRLARAEEEGGLSQMAMGGLRKKRRIQLMVIGAVMLAAATGITGYAMRDGIEFFRSPSQIAADPPREGERFRLGGLVEEGSVVRGNGEQVRFTVTDGGADTAVVFAGILPDLFREGQGVVATGKFEDGIFVATEVLARHDESYMPKEVADALKEQGVFQHGAGITPKPES